MRVLNNKSDYSTETLLFLYGNDIADLNLNYVIESVVFEEDHILVNSIHGPVAKISYIFNDIVYIR